MAHWESHKGHHPYKKPWSLGNAAELGQLVLLKCNLCRRTVHFLASDLLEFFDPTRPARAPLYPCSKCETFEFMRVTLRLPEPGDWGNLPVRRPAEVVHIQKWRTVKLGDEVRRPPPLAPDELLKRANEEFLRAEQRSITPPRTARGDDGSKP